MITTCVLKRYFDCVEHGFQFIVGQWKHRSSGIFFCFLPAFYELLLLIVHSALSYTLTAPGAFAERGVSRDLLASDRSRGAPAAPARPPRGFPGDSRSTADKSVGS